MLNINECIYSKKKMQAYNYLPSNFIAYKAGHVAHQGLLQNTKYLHTVYIKKGITYDRHF